MNRVLCQEIGVTLARTATIRVHGLVAIPTHTPNAVFHKQLRKDRFAFRVGRRLGGAQGAVQAGCKV